MTDTTLSMLDAALEYPAWDWPISPGHSIMPADSVMPGFCTCCKGACATPGKHPATAHGFYDASTDPVQIRRWGWCNRNIIGPTGALSGKDGLDVDPKNGGVDSLERLHAEHGPLPLTWRVRTGSGGDHYFFGHHAGLRNSTSAIAPGIDVRAGGGYVVLPPSLHKSGRRYEWIVGPNEAPLAAWPEWLLALLPPPRTRPTVPPSLVDRAAAAQAVPAGLLRFAQAGKGEGERNCSAFWLACRLVEECGPESAAAWTAMCIFGAACRPPMDEKELWRTWLSAGDEADFSPTTPVTITRQSHTAPPSYHRRQPHRRVYRPAPAEEVRDG